ncbi:MAG: nuclear transport factor 2 family protein [Myxococcota bacterium]
MLVALAACPTASPTPQPQPKAQPKKTAPAPTPTPTPAADGSADATPTPAAADDSLPSELRGDEVPEGARVLWRALEEIDHGNPDAMGAAMLTSARWFPPGSAAESIGNDDGTIVRGMKPWAARDLALDIRRVIDLGGNPLVVQLSVDKTTDPNLRFDLVLLVDFKEDEIASVRQYGDPLGPVRSRAEDTERTLDLGPPSPIEMVHGEPNLDHVKAAKAHLEAQNGSLDDLAPLLGDDAVLHDVTVRRTRNGKKDYQQGYQLTLGDKGSVQAVRMHAAGDFVMVEGAVHGRVSADDGSPREYGYVDIHRFEDGLIAETWHYVNLRGRPSRPGTRVAVPAG